MAEKYINRHDLLKKLGTFNWNMMIMRPKLFETVGEKIIHSIFSKIEEFPYIEIENDKCICGKWCEFMKDPINQRNYGGQTGYYECSNCKFVEDYRPNFCPNCGADMRGGT